MKSREWDGAGQVAIVTGPTGTGIGFHTARWLAERGCHVILAGRSTERLAKCAAEIKEVAKKADGTRNEAVQLTVLPLDVGSLKSVEQFAAEFEKLNLPLNLLLNKSLDHQHPATATRMQCIRVSDV
jgi:WW domain-containing oxidoreductase